jgi:hypothetical protein
MLPLRELQSLIALTASSRILFLLSPTRVRIVGITLFVYRTTAAPIPLSMYVCMYVCMYAYVYIYVCVSSMLGIQVCLLCMYMCMYVCLYECLNACMYVYVPSASVMMSWSVKRTRFLFISVRRGLSASNTPPSLGPYLHVCMHVCIYVYMCACIHVYMYVCMYIRMYAYLYVCLYGVPLSRLL